MRTVIQALTSEANRDRVLVERLDPDGRTAEVVTYGQAVARAREVAEALRSRGLAPGTAVGLVAGNTPDWIAADLALLLTRLVEVPVPLAFSAEQAASMLGGVTVCLADEAGEAKLKAWGLGDGVEVIAVTGAPAGAETVPEPEAATGADDDGGDNNNDNDDDDHIVKVIHTSGTTGVPKGVRIRSHGLTALLESLASVTPAGVYQRYLSLVPFSLLVEQVTAVYLPALTGGRVVLLPDSVPLLGTAGSRADEALHWLRVARPSAAVLPPSVVSALDKAVRGTSADQALGAGSRPFLMAGGAPVDVEALRRLDAAGVAVYEGYGLSENGSVVSWNTVSHRRPGTVGRPLPHCRVSLGADSELLVKSPSMFAGYTVEDPTSRPVDADGWLHTGDRAEVDADGYIRILGRLKNVIITGHGRNVSPEWVESRLRTCASVADAVLFGEGMEYLAALLVTGEDAVADGRAEAEARAYAEQALAETDRPAFYLPVPDTAALRDRYFTVTGRPRRELIFDDLIRPALAGRE